MEPSIEKLQEVFKSMSYGENLEDTSRANEWFRTIEIVDKSNEIDDVLKTVKSFKPARSYLLRLAEDIQKNAALIAQIEVLSRGVLTNDSRKATESLAQYFYYYALYVEEVLDGKGSDKTVVGVFEDDHPIWMLGLFLGPALASGHAVILQVGTKLAAVATFIVNLALATGIPKESLIVVPSNGGELQPYFSDKNVSVVALFVDVLNESHRAVNPLHKKVLILSAYKTPMLVFDDADLDSAVDGAIEAAWGYQGMAPWAVDTILVQENVFKAFAQKLKIRLGSVRIGNGNDRLAEIPYPGNSKAHQKLANLINKAMLLGVEVFQKQEGDSCHFTPTVFVGSKVHTNNVVSSPDVNCAVTLLAFRSIDEAVNLANNSRQGLGASVWSENVGLINEVVAKLRTGNVWINSHGLFSADVAFAPLKDSGVGYFGGTQGLNEYAGVKTTEAPLTGDLPNSFQTVDSVKNAIASGQKAGASWSKVPNLDRLKTFLRLLEFLEKNKKGFCEKLLKTFITNLEWAIQQQPGGGRSCTLKGVAVTVFKRPKGVLGVELRNPSEGHPVRLLLAALLEGNAVLLINETAEAHAFYQELSKQLPSGLLTVVPYSLDAASTASRHKELNGYYSTGSAIYGSLPLRESKMFHLIGAALDWDRVSSMVTVPKNVWSNVGQSSHCAL